MERALSPAGIYLHWPFCERKCPYCDFYTFGKEHGWSGRAGQYLDALLGEIDARTASASRPEVDTIYFGGGTPSLMGPEALGRLLALLRERFAIAEGAEVTLEVNPTTAEGAQLEAMLAAGVNRLSVGCQSFNDRVLARLGRVHDTATTRRALAQMRALNVGNLSLDVIVAAPTQTMEDLEADLSELLAFKPEHVSAYNLTIHEGTPYARWAKEGRLELPEEDLAAAMLERMIERLAEAGYLHYEISNWARPGMEARHNSKYWRDCDVWGFGVGAHGVLGGVRLENPRNLSDYLRSPAGSTLKEADRPVSERARYGEIMMLGLRRVPGADWSELAAWAGRDLKNYYAPEVARLRGEGLLEEANGRVRLTQRGFMVADTVAEAFF